MLGDFFTRLLVLLLGYAYPAFECFKSVEKNRIDIEELRFWCQYWIIVGILTVCERIGDIFISWLPMYGEMKLAIIIYLWNSKTKGTAYVYGTFLSPFLRKHEPEIDRKVNELKTRAWDFVIQYGQNITKTGHIKLFQGLHYLLAQSGNFTGRTNQAQDDNSNNVASTPTTRPSSVETKWPPRSPSTPPPNSPVHRAVAGSPKINGQIEHTSKMDRDSSARINERFQQARLKLRRSTTPIPD